MRRVFLLSGLVRVGLAVVLAAFVSFGLDYLLELPVVVRGLFLAASLYGLAFVFLRWLMAPLSRTFSDDDLALLVEESNPELKQSLITAIQLSHPKSEGARYVSSDLLASVVGDVEEQARGASFRRVLKLGGFRRNLAGLTALAAIAVYGAASAPDLFAIWLRRDLLLAEARWPKSTLLELDPSTPRVVAIGDNLPVAVRVIKGSPKNVTVERTVSGRTSRSRVMERVTLEGHEVFRHEFRNVSEKFSFLVQGGDDTIGPIEIDVRLRPRIDMRSVEITFQYPRYTGWDGEETPQRHPSIKVPVGTRVLYSMSTNIPVEKAYFVLYRSKDDEVATTSSEEPGETTRKGLELKEEKHFSDEFVVEGSGYYYFEFEEESGFRNLQPERFRIQAIPDRKPRVRIVEPTRITEEVSPEASVTVKVLLEDDYGIRRGVLEGVYFPPDSDDGVDQSMPLEGVAASEPGEAKTEHEVELILKVAEIQTADGKRPMPGARFSYFAIGEDFGESGEPPGDGSPVGNIGESQEHMLQIVDKNTLERLLTDQIMVVRDQLRELLNRQEAVRKDLESFQREMLLVGKIPTDEAHKLSRHRQEQHRITEGLERQGEELERILSKMEANNVGEDQWRSWVKGIGAEVESIAEDKSAAVEEKLGALRRDSRAAPQDSTQLAPVVGTQREIERDLRTLVMRLSEFGDRSALIQLLRDLRRRQEELRDQTRAQFGEGSPEESSK